MYSACESFVDCVVGRDKVIILDESYCSCSTKGFHFIQRYVLEMETAIDGVHVFDLYCWFSCITN